MLREGFPSRGDFLPPERRAGPMCHNDCDSRRLSEPLNRRKLLKSLLTVGSGALLTGLYAWRIEPHWLQFSFPTLPVKDLPPELEGKTLAQLSDLHVGPQVDDDYVMHSFRRLSELSPDFVVCTGDWRQFDQLRSVLAYLPKGRLGTVGILGNHDYGRAWNRVEVADEVAIIARESGVTMLRNEAVRLAGLQFIGIDDLWSPNFRPSPLMEERGGDEATIVLCHNPDAADRPVWANYRGWILSGHTHGGQCKPPFLPPPLLPVKNRRYTAGEFDLSGNRRLYISRGVGHLLHVRFNVRPEIPVFRLARAG